MNNFFVQTFDIYGVEPKLFIDQQNKYKTKFGAFLSFLTLTILLVGCWIYGKELYYKQNPYTTISDVAVKNPERYNLTSQNFNFAFGLQNSNWIHYIDPTVYEFKLNLSIMKIKGTEIEQETIDLKPRRCTKDDFTIDQEAFYSLGQLDNLFCINNQDGLFIQGDYGQEIFASITGSLSMCSDSSKVECKSEAEILKTLQGNYWGMYFTDDILNPKEFISPFTKVARNEYGLVQGNQHKDVLFYFENVFLEDNTGIIFDEISQQQGLAFASLKESQQSSNINGTFMDFGIRMQKVKQTKVYRNYTNLADVIANVGGILKISMVVFMFLADIVSSKLFLLRLVNEIFQFTYKDEKNQYKKNNLDPQNDLELYKNVKNYNKQMPNDANNKNQDSSRQNQKKSSFSRFLNVKNQARNIVFGKLKFKNMICFIANPFQVKHEKEKLKLYNFAKQKLLQSLNINNIIAKLIEVEKLKMLIMTDEQQNLFEFIPQPEISSDLINHQNYINQIQKKDNILKNNTNLGTSISMQIEKKKIARSLMDDQIQKEFHTKNLKLQSENHVSLNSPTKLNRNIYTPKLNSLQQINENQTQLQHIKLKQQKLSNNSKIFSKINNKENTSKDDLTQIQDNTQQDILFSGQNNIKTATIQANLSEKIEFNDDIFQENKNKQFSSNNKDIFSSIRKKNKSKHKMQESQYTNESNMSLIKEQINNPQLYNNIDIQSEKMQQSLQQIYSQNNTGRLNLTSSFIDKQQFETDRKQENIKNIPCSLKYLNKKMNSDTWQN
ncbi:hypothetical protein PPERSA_02348 [Pseudocohnilembus persalinus]|uniref:Transmembrane protein n=1 Tax=Pseudocohnilembus persalinus TaxID=266149 RepID=A0A0V0QV40_PSEPJ|nr:hypothetical protein PPERSA_02348 [Pseudocohnilembus persalinus]|eukprot:KRX05816.1 hypothetical protein PPERSA_02348 [Pseudocohnilembus persalinus]